MAKKYNNRYCFGYRSDVCGYPFRVSKRFKLETFVRGGNEYYVATGSANDALKVIRDLESDGFVPVALDNCVFRTRETYRVVFDKLSDDDCEFDKTYCVYRVL
jgi:hypothetical protein